MVGTPSWSIKSCRAAAEKLDFGHSHPVYRNCIPMYTTLLYADSQLPMESKKDFYWAAKLGTTSSSRTELCSSRKRKFPNSGTFRIERVFRKKLLNSSNGNLSVLEVKNGNKSFMTGNSKMSYWDRSVAVKVGWRNKGDSKIVHGFFMIVVSNRWLTFMMMLLGLENEVAVAQG